MLYIYTHISKARTVILRNDSSECARKVRRNAPHPEEGQQEAPERLLNSLKKAERQTPGPVEQIENRPARLSTPRVGGGGGRSRAEGFLLDEKTADFPDEESQRPRPEGPSAPLGR